MSDKGPQVIVIEPTRGEEESIALDPDRLMPGSPLPAQFVRNLYTDGSGRFFAGIWRSGVGAWRVAYTEDELCVLTEGKLRITDEQGRSLTFTPGQCFVMPAGFKGVWEVLEPAAKFYAIYEHPVAS